jgi:transposase
MWIATSDLPTTAAHPFYERLNRILDDAGFDAHVETLCARFSAPTMGRPSLAPGRYFRLLVVGYFEGLDSERAIAWRAADSFAVRRFPGSSCPRRRPIIRRSRARVVSSISKPIKPSSRGSCSAWRTPAW